MVGADTVLILVAQLAGDRERRQVARLSGSAVSTARSGGG